VGQDAVGTGGSVVADEHGYVVVAGDALHHAGRPRGAEDHACARIEPVVQQVVHRAVAVIDEHLGRAAAKCSADRRVGFLGHELLCARIAAPAAQDLIHRGHTGHAFHVDRDEDAHQSLTVSGMVRGHTSYMYSS
jgi:hypothetical protein